MNHFADYLFRNLPIGTVVTLTMDSGNYIGPVTFRGFYPGTRTVVFEEQGTITPPNNTTIYLSVDKIESVSFGA